MGHTFWQFKAAQPGQDQPKTGELLLYGPIASDDGVSWLLDETTPKTFKAGLDGLGDIAELRVMINSGGGDVFAGQAIHSMLARHPAHKTVYVDGLAASIASIVAMAGDTIIMPRNAMMMVHNPWLLTAGDARDFRKLADTLDSIRESMIAAYQSKTKLDRGKLITLLNAETWMTAQEAVDMGFADELETAKEIAASVVRPGVWAVNGLEFDLGRYPNAAAFVARWDAGQRAPTRRVAERALRDAGLSRSASKTIIARGWPGQEAAPSFEARAIPPHTTAKAPEGEAWDAPALADFTADAWDGLSDAEKRRIARHYVWTDEMPLTSFGALQGPHHKPGSAGVGPVVWRAISSGRMQQMREASDPGVRSHLEQHYHQFGRQAPWENSKDSLEGLRLYTESQQALAAYPPE